MYYYTGLIAKSVGSNPKSGAHHFSRSSNHLFIIRFGLVWFDVVCVGNLPDPGPTSSRADILCDSPPSAVSGITTDFVLWASTDATAGSVPVSSPGHPVGIATDLVREAYLQLSATGFDDIFLGGPRTRLPRGRMM